MTRFLFTMVAWSVCSITWSADQPKQSDLQQHPDWLVDMDEGIALSKSLGRPLLLCFSAADWCETCRRLNEEVFSRPAFLDWARDRFVLVAVDSPIDRSKLSQQRRSHHDQWLNEFRVAGFPTVFLVDQSGRPFAITGYRKGGVSAYLHHLVQLLQNRLIRDASLNLAAETTGETRARHLDAALSNVNHRLVAQHYAAEVASIRQLGNEQLQAKYASILERSAVDSRVVGTSNGIWSDDPLGSIGSDMKQAANFLSHGKLEPLVLDVHPRIERRLARLVELMEDSDSSNGGGKASQNADNPASESARRKRQAKAEQLLDITPGGQDWAKLTPKQREKIMQSKNEQFPSEFHDILSDYFRRLAKEEDANGDQ